MSNKNTDETNVTSAETETSKKRNFKKLKYGSMFYTIIVLVVAIVVVLNFMVSMVAKRSPIKIDITPDDRYELSDISINAVKALEKDVDITVTCKRDYFESLGNYYSNMYSQYYNAPAEVPYEMIPVKGPSGITRQTVSAADGIYTDLQGRRLAAEPRKGLYIKNGEKHIR